MATHPSSRRRTSLDAKLALHRGLPSVLGLACVLLIPGVSAAQGTPPVNPPSSAEGASTVVLPPPTATVQPEPPAPVVVPGGTVPRVADTPVVGVPLPLTQALAADPQLKDLLSRLATDEATIKELQGKLAGPAAPAVAAVVAAPKPAVVIPPAKAALPPDEPADDQEGFALSFLLPQLATLKSIWNADPMAGAPAADDAMSESALTTKVFGWNNQIRANQTSLDTVRSKIKANEVLLNENSRRLDANTLLLTKAKFNLQWAKTNNDTAKIAEWTKTQAALKSKRTDYVNVIKACHSQLVTQIQEASTWKKSIDSLSQNVALANDMISAIKAAAPIDGPPSPTPSDN